jgi:hypothetical protein
LAVELAAAKGNDSVGAADSPEHSGLFEAKADYGLAAGLDEPEPTNKCWWRNLGERMRSAFLSK